MQRPAEITYYDELGVAADATPEEIRESFRALVRILHPDAQTDQFLKATAERQMRKLNRVYAVLSDPERRRRYDESLEDDHRGPTIILSPNSNVNVHRLMERVAWIAALILVAVTLIWLSSDNPSPNATQTSERTPKRIVAAVPASAGVPAPDLARWEEDVRLLRMERDAALHELTRLRAAVRHNPVPWAPTEPTVVGDLLAPTTTEPPPPNLPLIPAAMAGVRVPLPGASNEGRHFAGFWFYLKPASSQHTHASSLYPPEFIETTITEQDGVIRGKYRSRYKIVDRAISPDVTFDFSGPASGSTAICPWTGPGGSRGELTLRIAGENGLAVDWSATELGSMQGLIRGTATLTRRVD